MAMQNRHLKQNDVRFQWSVFIFLNRGFQTFVWTKFPLSVFNTLFCSYLNIVIFWRKTQRCLLDIFIKNKFLYWELDFPVWFKSCRCDPSFQKEIKDFFKDCRPISILPNISKIYERFLNVDLAKDLMHNTA